MWNGMLDQLALMVFPTLRSITFTLVFKDAILVIWFMTEVREGSPHLIPQGLGIFGVVGPGRVLPAEVAAPAGPCGALLS